MQAHDILVARRVQLEQALAEIAEASPWALTIARLRCLRGIDTLSALGLVVEVGDFRRFRHPAFFPATSVWCRASTPQVKSAARAESPRPAPSTLEGCLSKPPGNTATCLVRHITSRSGNEVRTSDIDIAWRAQRRLYKRWQRLDDERRKRRIVVAVAVGRELACGGQIFVGRQATQSGVG